MCSHRPSSPVGWLARAGRIDEFVVIRIEAACAEVCEHLQDGEHAPAISAINPEEGNVSVKC
jgi:hypothetical protein